MKRFLSALCSYLIAFSPVMARDIVAPRSDEDIRIITKPGGTPTTSMRVDGSTGVPEVDSLKADSVEEKTSDNGVSIDGVTLKDGVVTGSVEGDATIVRTTGTQSIDGTKTFNDTISGDIDGDSATTSDASVVRTTRSVSTGSGLTGGGNLSADRTLSVDSTVVRTTGTQSIDGTKTFNDTISGDIDGDSATTSDASVVRTSRSVSTGSGLTGGGNLSTDRTLSVDSTVVRTTGDQSIGGTKTFSDGIVGPGSVPIGGMVAVMPTIGAATWQPPATGAIKDGFMRADGHQITAANVSAGSIIPEGVYLPNMVSMIARGGTASCDGSIACQSKTGGNDSVALVSGNLPNHTHSAGTLEVTENHFDHGHSDNFSVDSLGETNASLADGEMSASEFEHNHSGTFASTTHTHNLPKHYHSEASHTDGLGADSYSFTGSATVSISDPGHSHLQKAGYGPADGSNTGTFVGAPSWGGNTSTGIVSATTGISGNVTKSQFNHGHTITGYVGEDSGGCNGDLDTGCDTTQLISGGTASVGADNISTARTVTGTTNIAHGHGLSGSVTAYNDTTDAPVTGTSGDNGNPTPSNVDTLPAYQQVVWVIRVK